VFAVRNALFIRSEALAAPYACGRAEAPSTPFDVFFRDSLAIFLFAHHFG
jgi:hypothetical protein